MSTKTRDTEPAIFLRFNVSQSKCDQFIRMFAKVSKLDPYESLVGLSTDSGEMHLIFNFPIADGGLKESVKSLQSIFMRLYDFYPAFSEQPSDAHAESAELFIRDTKPTVRQANHLRQMTTV